MILFIITCILFITALVAYFFTHSKENENADILFWGMYFVLSIICSFIYLSEINQLEWNKIISFDRILYIVIVVVLFILFELLSPTIRLKKSEQSNVSEEIVQIKENRYNLLMKKMIHIFTFLAIVLCICYYGYYLFFKIESNSFTLDVFKGSYGIILIFLNAVCLYQFVHHILKLKKYQYSDNDLFDVHRKEILQKENWKL